MITRKNGNSLWQVYFLFADPCVAVMPMEMTRPSSPQILSMLSCWCSCFISPNPLSFFVWGGWVEMHIFLSLQPTPIPTNVHVLSSVLFPSLLHPKVELRSCPHTQTLTLYSVKRSVFSWTLLGGVITSQWPGMWGQEWGIETSFRLRIMDYLPNRFLSLKRVFYLTCRMHTYVEFFCLYR